MSPCILSDAVPQSICFAVRFRAAPLCCLTCFVTLFSFQGAGRVPSETPFPTAFAVRFEDPTSRSGLQIQRQIAWWARVVRSSNPKANRLVGPSGLEPPTLRLSVVRSSQLSYGPASSQSPLASVSAFAKTSAAPLLLRFVSNPLRRALKRFGIRGYALFSCHCESSPRRKSGVQVFREAKPCRRGNSLAPRILITQGLPQNLWFCGMVEIVGFEPATSCLQGRRSPS